VQDRALIRPKIAGDEVEERRLAGAVRADDAGDFVLAEREVDAVDGGQRAEAFGYAPGAEDFGANSRVT
jgi:hypothetical protein